MFLFGGSAVSFAGLDMNLRMYKYEHGYFAFPYLNTNVISVLAGDMTISAWIKTTQIHNEPDQPVEGRTNATEQLFYRARQ